MIDRKNRRRCRGSNPGHPRDRREYLPLYYNDSDVGTISKCILKYKYFRITFLMLKRTCDRRLNRIMLNVRVLEWMHGCWSMIYSWVPACLTSLQIPFPH